MNTNDICLCVNALEKTFSKGGYSNIVLDVFLNREKCDKKFFTALYYGVIERKITLDHIIAQYSSKPADKLDSKVLQVLRCGAYMLKFMNVPQNAAVNSSVEAVKQLGFTSAKGFVNGVLRTFLRANLDYTVPMDELHSFSIIYSAPLWLVAKWRAEYPEDFISLLQSTVTTPKTTLRLNTARFDKNDIISALESESISFSFSDILDDCIFIESGSVFETEAFKRGMLYVQDISSQLCSKALGAVEGSTILDVCAAPGGKSFTVAQYINDNGRVISCDLHEKRVKLIKSGADRLGLDSIETLVNDATKLNENIPMADFVLCDVVCSGLGVISKKPEIKYKSERDFEKLPHIQKSILNTSKNYVKKGGFLLYSTCTLNKQENEAVVKDFLLKNPDFEGVPFLEELGEPFGAYYATVLPKHFSSDGFFIAKFKRV
ncbi:MAG: 16S rRNA (cytosine(967)-C(5))-methyltransferase RsmB [Oscillospiraceae bacterium]|nr:16S rRNA (cytosine(967)-C(5))-methyltransferase RsmB [Oscillospiraceae bacterium]